MALITIELEPGESVTIKVRCDGDYYDDDPEPDELPEEVEREFLRAVGE